jgi:hypothetical protein
MNFERQGSFSKKIRIIRNRKYLFAPKLINQLGILKVFLLNIFILVLLYLPYRRTSFTIDDPVVLSTFGNEKVSIYSRIFETVWSGRWRPISWSYYTFGAELFQGSFLNWWIAAIALMSLNTLLFIILLGIMKVQPWAIFGLSLLFTTSRFLFGFPLNIAFATEILSVSFILLMLIFLNLYDKTKNIIYVHFSILILFLLYLAHERFVFVSVYLCFVIGTRYFISKRIRLFMICFTVLIMAALMIGKRYFFGIPLLLGTGSSSELGASVNTVIHFTSQFVLRALGLNAGEPYLSGYTWNIQSNTDRLFSIALILLTLRLLLVSYGIKYWKNYRLSNDRNLVRSDALLFALLFFVISGPAVMTIRLEDRWLLLPFLILLLMIGHGFLVKTPVQNQQKNKTARVHSARITDEERFSTSSQNRFLALFVMISLFMNYNYIKSMDLIYFRWSQSHFEKSIEAVKSANVKALEGGRLVFILDDKSSPDYLQLLTENIRLRFNDERIEYVVIDSLLEYKSRLGEAGLLIYSDYILKELDLSKSANRLSFSGDFWPDGWAGKAFTIQIIDPRCERLKIDYLSDWRNSVTVRDDLAITLVEKIGIGSQARIYDLKPNVKSISFEFRELRKLNEENGEQRAFSTKVQATCLIR